jgi:hypothetical protein
MLDTVKRRPVALANQVEHERVQAFLIGGRLAVVAAVGLGQLAPVPGLAETLDRVRQHLARVPRVVNHDGQCALRVETGPLHVARYVLAVARQRRANRHASRWYQVSSLTFVQPAHEPSR